MAETIHITIQGEELRLLIDFIHDALDQLNDLEEAYLAIEESEGRDEDRVQGVFRIMHTIKGTSGFFGLNTVVRLSHRMENVLDRLRQKTLAPDGDMTDCLLMCTDRLSQILSLAGKACEAARDKQDGAPISMPDMNIEDTLEWLDAILARKAPLSFPGTAEESGDHSRDTLVPPPCPQTHKFDREHIEDFTEEVKNHLQEAETILVAASKVGPASMNELLRAFHTVKGSSGLLLAQIEDEKNREGHILNRVRILAHHAETLAQVLRDGEDIEIDQDAMDILARTVDLLNKMGDAFAAGENGPDINEAARSCVEEARSLKTGKKCAQVHDGYKAGVFEEIVASLRDGLGVIRDPEKRAATIETMQQALVGLLEKCACALSPGIAAQTTDTLNIVNFLASDWTEESARLFLPEIEIFLHKLEAIASLGKKLETPPEAREKQPPDGIPGVSPRQESARHSTVIKVPQARLDEMMNLIGELLVSRNALLHLASIPPDEKKCRERADRLKEMCHEIGRIGDSLQTSIMNIRMTPVNQVFSRFPRLVRDLSRKLDKKIRLETTGAETELDRKVVDALGDPLVHLIRNAADHGIEDSEERKAACKPDEALIRLGAVNQGQWVIVSLSDDGRGIDAEAVAKKALKIGVVSENKLSAMTDDEKRMFIFTPGLSSAARVTEVSGRGVGMDVVKRGIEDVGGSITLASAPGKGTTVNLHLPLSLAVNRGLEVEAAGHHYYLPLEYVLETVKTPHSALHRHREECMAVIRGDVLPVRDLAMELGLRDRKAAADTDGEMVSLVILGMRGTRIALRVDRFLREGAYVLKPLTGIVGDVPWIMGAMITVRGRLVLVLDPAKFEWVR